MKRNNRLLIYISIICIIMLSACGLGAEYKRNANYTYGTLDNVGIQSIYELEGTPSQHAVALPIDISKNSNNSSYVINVCKVTSGGVVAYGNGMYVYSPDKNDENGVINALISECVRKQEG